MPGEIDNLQIQISADSESASQNVLALADSLEKIATAAANATAPLAGFTKALSGLKSFDVSGFSKSATDLSQAFNQFNNIGSIDNASQFASSVENLRKAMSGLSDVSKTAGSLKLGNTFSSSVNEFAESIKKLSEIGNMDDAYAVWASIKTLSQVTADLPKVASNINSLKIAKSFPENIANLYGGLQMLGKVGNMDDAYKTWENIKTIGEATSGLHNIAENINSLKVGKSFDTNIENLSIAMAHLNEIGDTSAFAGGVESISQAIESLNNIEVGQGFISLVQASSQWADAISKMNDIRLGANFSEGIARVARAAEILNDVDFGGFKRMNDALASLPDNVRISFGASSTEVQELTEHLVNLNNTVQSIQTNLPQRRQRNAETIESSANAKATDRPDYSWSNDEVKGTLERASAFNKEAAEIKKVLAAYETMGEQVPESVIRAAESLGVFNSAMDETGAKASTFGDKLKDASRAVATGAFKALGAEVKAVMSPLTAIGSKFKSLTAKAGQFASSIKRIAMYRAIRAILKAITEGFEEGRKNLYYYSQAVGTDFAPSMDKAATAALYLKNSIGAATAPLTNYLVPMIDRAVDRIVELINKFNELTAVLTGASTWTKAVKYPTTWQDSLDDANKSAKKLKSTMLGFDELNVIEITDTASKKSGFDADDYIRMFEEVKTDLSVGSKIPELLMPVKLAWDAEGDNTLKTIKDTWHEILALIGAVGESFRKVWLNGTGQKSLELILQIVQNIIGTYGELAKGIRKAWEENETGTRIIQSIWNIANNDLTVFRDIGASIREWASGLDWSPLLTSLASLGEAIERFTNPESALARIAESAFDKILLPLGKWLIEEGLPAAVDLLTTSFDALGVALEFLEPLFQKVIDFLSEIGGFTFNNISGLASSFTAFMQGISGQEIDGEIGQRAEEKNKKLIESLGGKDSWYGKLNKKLIDFGSHGMHDFLTIDLPNAGAMWSEILNGTEDQKGIFGQIGDLIKGEFADNDVEIISEKSMAAFDSDVLTITAGYKDIKKTALDANKATNETKPASGIAGLFESLKASYKSFSDDWGNGIDAMKLGFIGFTDSIKAEWQTFKDDWGNGVDAIKQGFSGFAQSVKSEWQLFKDDWANGLDAITSGAANAWENIKTFFSDGWESIKGGVSTFGTDWSNGWNGMKQSVSDMWKNAKTDFESGWTTVQNGADNFKKSFSASLSTIKRNVSDTWGKVTATLSSKWDEFKNFVDDYKSNWQTGFDTIADHVAEAWGKIKDKIGNSILWQNMKQRIADYAGQWFDKFAEIKQNVSDTMRRIVDNVTEKISSIVDAIQNSAIGQAVANIVGYITDTVGKIWGDDNSGIKGTFKNISDGLHDFIEQMFDGLHLGSLGDKIKNTLNTVIEAFETAVNYIIKGLNFFVEKANDALDIHIDIPNWVPMIGGNSFDGFSFQQIPEFTFYKFANGGFPDKGSLFLANEPGNPEMIGKIGSQTAVANNDQIVQAVSKGVYEAVVSAMSQNRNGESGKTELHVYLDRQEITSQVEQQQRDNGVSIMSGLVYT